MNVGGGENDLDDNYLIVYKPIRVIMDIDSLNHFIKFELDRKYPIETGPVQLLSLTLADEVSLEHIGTRDYGGYLEVDFKGGFCERISQML